MPKMYAVSQLGCISADGDLESVNGGYANLGIKRNKHPHLDQSIILVHHCLGSIPGHVRKLPVTWG